jgi:hypothetical protein
MMAWCSIIAFPSLLGVMAILDTHLRNLRRRREREGGRSAWSAGWRG